MKPGLQANSTALSTSPLSASAWSLATIAALALEWVRLRESHQPALMLLVSGGTLALILLARRLPQGLLGPAEPSPTPRSAGLTFAVVVGLALMPLLSEWIGRRLGMGESAELVQFCVLRNFMLGLIALAQGERLLKLACVVSLFLMLGVLLFLPGTAGYLAIAAYAVCGLWLLLATSWDRLRGHFPVKTEREMPWRISTLAIGLAVGLVLLFALQLSGIGPSWERAGYFGSSGGQGAGDPFASRGVGDGPNLVSATQSASAIGAVESELFLDSNSPSLYDVFNDTFGEPLKNGPTERAVALAPEKLLTNDARATAAAASNQSFSTIRTPFSRGHSPPPKIPANLLGSVSGRTPLHLRLETFETFDGQDWTNPPRAPSLPAEASPRLFLVAESLRAWATVEFDLPQRPDAPVEQRTFKVHKLRTARIPTPNHPVSLHIDQVDRSDFFCWTADHVFEMPGRLAVPGQLVIHLRSQAVDPAQTALAQGNRPEQQKTASERSDSRNQDACDEDAAAIQALARQWAGAAEPGWPQVQAVVSRLQQECLLDPAAVSPRGATNTAAEFLLRSRRGPSYQFATAAAVLLESLGYRCRLATGLYADPANFDWRARETAIYRQNAHVWVEVQAAGGYWLTVEPTPGYATCPPYRSWAEVAQQALVAAGNWLLRHWLAALLTGMLLATLVLFRRTLEECACWLVWRARLGGSPRSDLRTTIWLLEGRLRRAGRPRPPQVTFSRWFQQVAGRAASGPLDTPREPLATFLRQASWAQYAEHSPALPAAEIRALCTAIVREWSPQRLAQLRPARPPLAVLRPRLLRTLFRWNAT